MMGLGGATRYKILQSQSRHEKAGKIYSHTLLFAVTLGLVFFVVGQFGTEAIVGFPAQMLRPLLPRIST
ncbi:MAG: hypothetical protein U5K84_13910 [Alkalibacterium sp.]|nr:hypothetical protein [Alkalibacterium sp.]